jgi:hypothetical protein
VEDGEAAETGVEGGQAAGAGQNSAGDLQTWVVGTFFRFIYLFKWAILGRIFVW